MQVSSRNVDLPREYDWSYLGTTGPEHWGSLNSEYSLCAKGYKQSPINIQRTVSSPFPLGFNYRNGDFRVEREKFTIKLIPLKNNSIIVQGNVYQLIQLHFHTPSEHLINGKQSDLEIHLVHEDVNQSIVVIGILVKVGNFNKEFQKIIHSKSLINKKEQMKVIKLNLQSFIPTTIRKVNYEGSLTTPPCTEGVNWIVFTKPIQFSKNQITTYQNTFYPSNRPVQPLNIRKIYESW